MLNEREIVKLIPIKKQGSPNADFLYGLLVDSKNKDITKKQIRNERLQKLLND